MSSIIEPMVIRNNAWLLYLYTPADDPKLTHGEELYLKYKNDNTAFCEIKTIEDTTDHNGKALVAVESLKSVDMTQEEIRREFYCDFEAYRFKRADQGGTFVEQLSLAESEGRIGIVPHDPAYKVNTYWDIGIVDYTAIWFLQEKQETIDIIDFYINRGKSLEFYFSKWPDFAPFKEKAQKSPDEQIEVLHIVTLSNEKSKKQNLAYSFTYIYLAEQQIISESGYSYFPFFITRWIKEEGEVYGYAPAHHVLPDIKLLNSLRQITLKVAQKQLDPPLLVPKDGYYLPLYTKPGSVNFYRNGMADKIVPLSGMENIMPTEIEQNQCRDAIFKAFYIDIFRMQKENKEMTAMEVQIRNEEQMRMMSPMVGRIETEFLNPLIKAIYGILTKYNKLPILEGLETIKIDIAYTSPLTRAQKSSSISSIEQVIGFFQRSGIINFCPEIYDNIDFDSCFKLFFELRGAPQSVLKSEQEVIQLRQQRKIAQMQQAQQAMQMQQPVMER